MIAGTISSSGQILTGTGFALERTGPGAYAIHFLDAFGEAPVLLVTAAEPAHTAAAVATTVGGEITVCNRSGTRADGGFSFAAVAPS
jgi:hypothetical protein